ncbi:MAG: serine hydrolase domain-containing protein [Caldilineaceae bacterium]
MLSRHRWLTALLVAATSLLLNACQPVVALPPANAMVIAKHATQLAQLEATLETLRQQLQIPAMSAAVVKDQKLLWAKGFGQADLAAGVAATADTPYHLASLTKPVAAVILLQLVEAGLLDLEEPVATYGIHLAGPGIVRVKHLLTHTSEGEPGAYFHYSGERFALLGRVIQQASGHSFQELLDERILKPLALTNTAPDPAGLALLGEQGDQGKRSQDFDHIYQALAKPYRLDAQTNLVPGRYPDQFSTAAGLISTVIDLAKFDIALDQDKLLRPATKARMFTPTVSTNGAVLPYGLGWFVEETNGTRLIWHYGLWECNSSLLLKVPDQGLTFIILANTDNLSRPYNLGGPHATVLNSAVARAFYQIFVLPAQK